MSRILVSSWFHTFLLLLLLSGAVFVRLQDYEWSRSLRYLAFDTFNAMHPRQPTGQVVVVDIDEVSMSHDDLGQWPWPRHTVARLVDRLKEMGARAIVFDVVFAEYDRTSPGAVLKAMPEGALPDDMKAVMAEIRDHDAILADSIRSAGNVVTGFIWSANKDATRRKPVLSKPISLSRDAAEIKKTVPRMIGVTTNIPELAQAAAGSGCFGVSTDIDGLIRQVPLLFSHNDILYPSLALEALRVAQDPRLMVKIRALKGNEMGPLDPPLMMQVGKYEIPLDQDGKFFVYFSKARPDQYIPAWKIIGNAIDPAAVKGKIAIVGTSAEGLKDIRSTPLDLFVPGVEVHMNVIEQVLSGKFLKRPILLSGVELIFMIAIGILIIVLAPFVGAVTLAFFTMALIGGMAYSSWHIFLHYGLMLDPVYPSLGVMALFVMASLLAYIRTEAERKRVRDAFSHYISPDFMKELTEHPDKLKLGGEVRELSVMFTDIRNFTGISERLSPELLIQLMNDFLTPMSALVMENRGTIDKYMGDAMMAFWNAPLGDPDHARHACLTALAIDEALRPVNERLRGESQGSAPLVLEAGIGIHTGPASVGNMGSKQRFAYSALGDTVNLASRLEGQTKAYGVSLLISQSTRDAVPGLAALELDCVRVKGKMEPVRIFTLIGDESVADTPGFQEWKSLHDRMIAAYRAMDFDGADTLLAAVRQASGGRLGEFYTIFEARLKGLRTNPPSAGWDGVYEAQSK